MRQFKMDTRWGPEHVVLMEASEIPDISARGYKEHKRSDNGWCGGTYEDLLTKGRQGDESLVQSSEAIMCQIEDQIPITRGWSNMDDVVGAIPNVPAFLAGHPQHMRRRHRVARDNAPLALYVDLTSHAIINASDVQKRGVALLALARMLVEHRPVTLWAGITQDVGSGAGTVAWRIDTTPLDLARAAYHISATNISRRFGYGVNTVLNRAGGGFAFKSAQTQISSGEERTRMMLDCGEVLHVPVIYGTDPLLKSPIEWLKRNLTKYISEEAA